MLISRLHAALFGLGLLTLLSGLCHAETVLMPRTAAEREADLKALSEKYAPRADPQLEVQLRQSGGALPTDHSGAPTVSANAASSDARLLADAAASVALGATSAPAPGTKVRIELYPSGLNKFTFSAQIYDVASLQPVLEELATKYKLDHIVLLNGPESLVELSHLVELAKLGKALALPAVYQEGNELKAVDTR